MVRTRGRACPRDRRRRRGSDAFHHDRRRGMRTFEDARTIARAVADSPLVKTAIHGADPNWGRIVSAAGYSGVAFDEDRPFALDQRRLRSTKTACRLPFDAERSRSRSNRIAMSSSAAAQVGHRGGPVLDMRPDGRVYPAQRGLHDLRAVSLDKSCQLPRSTRGCASDRKRRTTVRPTAARLSCRPASHAPPPATDNRRLARSKIASRSFTTK